MLLEDLNVAGPDSLVVPGCRFTVNGHALAGGWLHTGDMATVDDAGFTAQILTSLPAKKRRNWLRPVIMGTAAIVDAILLWTFWLSDPAWLRELGHVLQARSLSAIPFMPVLLVAVLLWTGYVALADEQ